jgi:hypothetical protein
VALVPGLLQISAVIDGDAVKPGAPGGFAAKLSHLAKGFEKNIMRGVLGLLRVAQETESEIINRPAVLLINFAKFRRPCPGKLYF